MPAGGVQRVFLKYHEAIKQTNIHIRKVCLSEGEWLSGFIYLINYNVRLALNSCSKITTMTIMTFIIKLTQYILTSYV